jgi:O-succinylbenzoic acid--CoA ligase
MKLSVFDVAERHPSALALITPELRFSYAELAVKVSATAAQLEARGLLQASAEPVAVVARPGLSCLCVLHALWAYGVATFTLPARLPAEERATWAARARARAIVDPDDVDSLSIASPSPVPPELAPEAPFAIVPTSGSTGAPKLVVLSRGAFSASAQASAANLPLDQQDRWLLCLPLSHIGGLSILTRCLLSASAVVAFDPGRAGLLARLPELATCLERDQVSVVSLVPTLLDALLTLAPPWQPGPALRAVLLGGAATHAELLARARLRGVPVLVTYGLTESCSQVATTRVGTSPRVRSGLVSVGPALPGIELKIDETARICVRGPTLCTRFIDGERAIDEQSWLRTGDRGYLDEAGELFVLGRASDVIITGGENVDPVRVEAALVSAPGVKAAAVFAVPDPRFGELVVCALVPSGDFRPSLVRAALERVLAPHELPRQLALLDALPELPNGKLDRPQVRSLATASLAPWPRSEPLPPGLD